MASKKPAKTTTAATPAHSAAHPRNPAATAIAHDSLDELADVSPYGARFQIAGAKPTAAEREQAEAALAAGEASTHEPHEE